MSRNLYYYTSVNTMRFILQNGNIYATNLRYMNDGEEYLNGVRELGKIFIQEYPQYFNEEDKRYYEEKAVDSYSISFSTQRDLLSQWFMYAKESGVNLRMEFDKEHTYEIREFMKEVSDPKIKFSETEPQKVYYCTEATMNTLQYEEVRDEINRNISGKLGKDLGDSVKLIFGRYIPYIKRYEFNAEEEYRLVFNQEEKEKLFHIDYRVDNNVLKPYIDVNCEGGWPVREIIVGPGFNQHQVFESIRHFLEYAELKLPVLSDTEFQERCEEYLQGYFKDGKQLPSEWDSGKKSLTGDKVDRYKNWLLVIQNLGNDEELEKYLKHRFLSRDGVILTKSVIPYIY